MKTRQALLLATAALAVSGCALFGPEVSVRVVIPHLPEYWKRAFPDLWFLLVFRDGTGSIRTVRASVGALELSIPCAKSGNSPVLAFPRASADGGPCEDAPGPFKPAGGLYPGSLGESRETPTLLLSWQDGPVAYLMSQLAERGLDTALVNAARLSGYLSKAQDPWSLDLESIAQKLADGDFTAYDVRALPSCAVKVAPGPGHWFSESPFFGAPEEASQGQLGIPLMSYGLHYLFSLEGRLSKIQVGKEGTVMVMLR
jgi:hypothetical protein